MPSNEKFKIMMDGIPRATSAVTISDSTNWSGIPEPFSAYMAPVEPPLERLQPGPQLPLVISPGWPPSPISDPGIGINGDVAALVALGMRNVDALRLLMLCDWSCARATAVYQIATETGHDPIKMAKKHLR